MKINWAVACAFILDGLLYVLPGRRVDNNPLVIIGCIVFLIAFIGLEVWLLARLTGIRRSR